MSVIVKSKYNPVQVIVTAIACLMLWAGSIILHANTNPPTVKAVLGSVILAPLGIAFLIIFFQRAPRIRMDENGITVKQLFKTYTYPWENVSNVLLTTQERYSILIFGYDMEAMKLILDENKALIVWSDMYRNMRQLRSFVSFKVENRIHFLTKKAQVARNFLEHKKYSGNVVTSFNTLLILGMTAFFLFTMKPKPQNGLSALIPLSFILVMYVFLGTQMHYFEIHTNQLIIKNHYFPWLIKHYELNDIEEVALESPYRRSDGLRIITYDFKSKLYCAGSLRNRTWRELLSDLKEIGIKTASSPQIS